MLIDLVGHNDKVEAINPRYVRRVVPGNDLGTTHIYLIGDADPVVVQGFYKDVRPLLRISAPGASDRPE